MKPLQLMILPLVLIVLAACAQKNKEAPAENAASKPAPAAPAVKAAPVEKPAGNNNNGVKLLNLADGATVGTDVPIKFGVTGKSVRPAGQDVTDKTSGHHHIIIDGAAMPAGTIIPMDEQHKHFGKGQTETVLKLTPGSHTLTLQFADGAHRSYGPAWSQTIKVMSKAAEPAAAPAAAPPTAAPKKAE